jgi:phosphoribosylformylglycinamidine synthase
MAEACVNLELPVIGGNVSLYNESGGSDIDPTPVIGLLGVVDELVAPPPGWNWGPGDTIVLVGARYAEGERPFPLAGSRWATKRGRRGGVIEGIDLEALSLTLDFVVNEIASICAGDASDVTAVHDVSGGGLAGSLAEMVAATGIGAEIVELEGHAELFSEFPGRFVMATSDVEAFQARARAAGVSSTRLGMSGGDRLRVGSMIDLPVTQIAARRRDALEDALGALN